MSSKSDENSQNNLNYTQRRLPISSAYLDNNNFNQLIIKYNTELESITKKQSIEIQNLLNQHYKERSSFYQCYFEKLTSFQETVLDHQRTINKHN